jgi:DNA-binding transcriptional ArsR family regulator
MRALAHPTRLALLEALNRHETLTASEASELVGESPTNCAFHLRTLGKYGFIEEGGDAPGRRRPWRRRSVGVGYTEPGHSASPEAAVALSKIMWEGWLDRARAGLARYPQLPAIWQRATGASSYSLRLTAADAEAMTEELREVLDKYRDRPVGDADAVGAKPIDAVLFVYPHSPPKPKE